MTEGCLLSDSQEGQEQSEKQSKCDTAETKVLLYFSRRATVRATTLLIRKRSDTHEKEKRKAW